MYFFKLIKFHSQNHIFTDLAKFKKMIRSIQRLPPKKIQLFFTKYFRLLCGGGSYCLPSQGGSILNGRAS